MGYLGGKSKIAKWLARYINSIRKPGQLYIEPFVGAAWVLVQVQGEPRIASDVNPCLICIYQATQQGWTPPTSISEDAYKAIKEMEPKDLYASALKGVVGFGCSFAGKWFAGYARDNRGGNYAQRAHNSLMKKLPAIRDVTFHHVDYRYYNTAYEGALIYCDPPYANTTTYGAIGNFDTKVFWDTIRCWSNTNTVMVSEYQAPDDFDCVLEIPTRTVLRDKTGNVIDRTERLFMWRS